MSEEKNNSIRGLAIEWWPIGRPTPYGKNPRKHTPAQIDQISQSIREFGWRQPIVVDTEGVIALGHGRLLAAQQLGQAMVPVHVASELTPAQIRALRIMDNRSQDESSWDEKLLDIELVELADEEIDLTLTGFSEDEIAELHGRVTQRAKSMANLFDKEKIEAGADKLKEKWGTQVGQIWDIPSVANPKVTHRLLVGDSLVDFDTLLDGAKVDGVCSDPPYDLKARSVAQALNGIGADIAIMLVGDSQAFDLSSYWAMRLIFVWKHKGRLGPNKNMPIRFHTLAPVYTRMPDTVLGYVRPTPDFGTIFGADDGASYITEGDFGQSKTPEVFQIMMSGFKWKVVADPFAGSGPSLIACETTARQWYGAELNTGHAAIILERASLAGLKPVLAEKQPGGELKKRGRGRPRKEATQEQEAA